MLDLFMNYRFCITQTFHEFFGWKKKVHKTFLFFLKRKHLPKTWFRPRSDGRWIGPKSSTDLRRRELLRGSSQREGASSASVVSCVSIFVIVLKYTKRDFEKKATKNVDFSLWGKMRVVTSVNCSFSEF